MKNYYQDKDSYGRTQDDYEQERIIQWAFKNGGYKQSADDMNGVDYNDAHNQDYARR